MTSGDGAPGRWWMLKFKRPRWLVLALLALVPLVAGLAWAAMAPQERPAGLAQKADACFVTVLLSPYALPVSLGIIVGLVAPVPPSPDGGAFTFTNTTPVIVIYWVAVLALLVLLLWKRRVWTYALLAAILASSS